RCWLPTNNSRSTDMSRGSPSGLLAFAEQFLRDLRQALGLEPIFSQQLLERGGRAEGFHAHNATRCADVAFPAEGRGLLHGEARGYDGRQHAVSVRLRLMFENIPRRHRNHARADALGEEFLVGLYAQADLAS